MDYYRPRPEVNNSNWDDEDMSMGGGNKFKKGAPAPDDDVPF